MQSRVIIFITIWISLKNLEWVQDKKNEKDQGLFLPSILQLNCKNDKYIVILFVAPQILTKAVTPLVSIWGTMEMSEFGTKGNFLHLFYIKRIISIS